MTGQRHGRTGRGRAPIRDTTPTRVTTPAPSRTGHEGTAIPPRADRGRDAGSLGVGPAGRGALPPADPADPADRAREICLRLLASRPRTRAELATALRRNGIAADVTAEVLDRYGEVGVVDDRAFARAWVTSRHHGRGLAGKALAGELRRKGVDSEAVSAALTELDDDTEANTARALVERKLRTDRGGPPMAVFRRMVGMLARKGYPAGLAIMVVKEALAERADADLEAADLGSFDADILDYEAGD
jgi:regulatory protein